MGRGRGRGRVIVEHLREGARYRHDLRLVAEVAVGGVGAPEGDANLPQVRRACVSSRPCLGPRSTGFEPVPGNACGPRSTGFEAVGPGFESCVACQHRDELVQHELGVLGGRGLVHSPALGSLFRQLGLT